MDRSSDKIRYIGGDLELAADFHLKTTSSVEDYFCLQQAGDFVSLSLGRDALKLAFMNEGLLPGDEVLVPSYLCMKVVDAIEELQLSCRFFDVDSNLNWNEEAIRQKITKKTRGLVLIDYFGFSRWDEVFLKSLKEEFPRLVIVADLCQALYSLESKTFSESSIDYWCVSLRKFFPVADGAFLVSRNKKIDTKQIRSTERYAVAKRTLGKIIKESALKGDYRKRENLFLSLIESSEKEFGLETDIHSFSPLSRAYMQQLDPVATAVRRRENAAFLCQNLDPRFLLFSGPGSAVPLAVPIRLNQRDAVRADLMEQGIFLPIHWPLDHRLSPQEFPKVYQLNNEILSLVVDQRYTILDLEYLLEKLNESISKHC